MALGGIRCQVITASGRNAAKISSRDCSTRAFEPAAAVFRKTARKIVRASTSCPANKEFATTGADGPAPGDEATFRRAVGARQARHSCVSCQHRSNNSWRSTQLPFRKCLHRIHQPRSLDRKIVLYACPARHNCRPQAGVNQQWFQRPIQAAVSAAR